MILGDSLQVMASLAARESLRGKVQCDYFDPPDRIRFNSNWQVAARSRDVKDGSQADIRRRVKGPRGPPFRVRESGLFNDLRHHFGPTVRPGSRGWSFSDAIVGGDPPSQKARPDQR